MFPQLDQWRFSAQVLEALASCLENPRGLKVHSKYTAVQTDGELATFDRGKESENLLEEKVAKPLEGYDLFCTVEASNKEFRAFCSCIDRSSMTVTDCDLCLYCSTLQLLSELGNAVFYVVFYFLFLPYCRGFKKLTLSNIWLQH
ncbi:hypothetical protein AVEN_194207-1 [Araneus ventricosus]|uniref:Uncharacterized protein n=1 Tax=Araneus ventricosus TaxID=182803 RepID=A0A4Y2N1J7_ARAVE|nr:hypothetical protein AVEN_194207-1 [Araneus ventricosus]